MNIIPELVCTIDGAIGQVVLNRPNFHNAINKQMWDEIPLALEQLKLQGAKVIIFTGAGASFAAGADLYELEKLSTRDQARKHWFSIRDCLNFIAELDVVTIAKINGACIGGGCLLAIACDLRYASEASSFGIPVARLGIVLDDANIKRLVSLVGPATAQELIFSALTISGADAFQHGLINRLCSALDLDKQTQYIAEQIADNAQVSTRQAKISIGRVLKIGRPDLLQDEELVVGSYIDSEFKERIKRVNAVPGQ